MSVRVGPMVGQPGASSAASAWSSCHPAARHQHSRRSPTSPPGGQSSHRGDRSVAACRLPLLCLRPPKESEVPEQERSRGPGEDGDHPRRCHPDVCHPNHHPSSGPRGLPHHPERVGDLSASCDANVRNPRARHIGARTCLWCGAIPDDEEGCGRASTAMARMVLELNGHQGAPPARPRSVGMRCLDRPGAGTRVRAESPSDGR